ncbi:MAG: F0F1 ATP synthase subunit delta [Dehalococcoidia bacterium]|nr:MAG: F0F1 ATP synthase subunit delta [Dehalococcoidia bacterium]
MAETTAARRYAQAVFGIAKDQNRLDGWDADLATIADALHQRELRAALESAKVPFAAKQELVSRVFSGAIDPLAQNLLLLLSQRGRLHLLDDIIAAYRALVDEERGIARARVTTAVPLDESEQQRVAARLAELTGKQIRLETAVDPSILGGLIARIGDKLIDGSTRTRLIALRQRLAAG